MNQDTWAALEKQFASFPITRARERPSADEVAAAAAEIGCAFHDDYIAYLLRYGAGMVGSLPVFGLRAVAVMGHRWSVIEVTKWFRKQGWKETDRWYVVSEDGFGNPIGIAPDGSVMISDHDVGGANMIAPNFEEFLIHRCLGHE